MIQRKKVIRSKAGFTKRNSTLASASAKQIKRLQEYQKLRKWFLLEKAYICEVCGGLGDQVHHKARRGKNLCAIHTFLAVCGPCHQKIHDNPAWAKKNGYLTHEFNRNASAEQ